MRAIALVLFIAALLAGARFTLAAAPPAHAPALSVTLDGEPVEVEVHSLSGAFDRPRAGDMAGVAGYALTLDDAESRLTLVTDERHPGRLYLVGPDGGRTLIAARVRRDDAGDRDAVLDPFPGMTPEEIAGLRGVLIEAWAPELRDALGALPPSAAVRIDVGIGPVSPILEALPEGLERLWLEWRGDDDGRLAAALGRLEHLRALVLDLPNTGFDAAALGERPSLLALRIRARGLDHAAALAGLAGLRSLELTWCGGVEDVGFVRAMPGLRRLRIAYTEVSSLAALGGHAAIEAVDADASGVELLPAGAIPSLRELRLLGSSAPEAEVERFKGANPGCRVVHRWGESLQEGLAGCDRLRVRSGGTCHRDRDSEETLFEADGAAAVGAVLKLIEIDEDHSGFHCRCCGDPTLEFYRGGELVGMVGFHHGQSLRWVGGWPGDGALTRASAAKLVQWLADEGVVGPLQDRRVEDEREQAAMRRIRVYESVIPADNLDALREAGSKEEAVAAFRQGLEPSETAALMFKLLGCHSGAWRHLDPFEDLAISGVLPGLDPGAILAAAERASGAEADEAERRGAARWLLGEGKWRALVAHDAAALDRVIAPIGAAGLRHPDGLSRRRAMLALSQIDTGGSRDLLRQVLQGGMVPADAAPEDRINAGGKVVYRGDDPDEDRPASDAVFAAVLLGDLGDRQSLAAAEALLERTEGEDRAMLEEAVAKLR